MKIDLQKIPFYLIYTAPTVHLAFGKRFGDLFNLLSVLCIYIVFKYGIKESITNKKLFYFFSILYFIYPLEIFVSQLLRWQWHIHDYMDQIRFIFVYPVFLYLIDRKIDLLKFIERAVPIALILSYFSTKYIYIDNQFGDRFTNNFTDPLAYGQICLSMSLLLITTFFYSSSEKITYLNFYKLIGILFGVIISIKTQSRTGWFAFPIVAMLLIYLNIKYFNIRILLLTIITLICFLFGSYTFVDIIHNRINQAITEILTYPWSGGVAPDTSVGLRITFVRIGWFYITHNPWYGMGNKGFFNLINSPDLKLFASNEAVTICYEKLFHNELVTQTVRYGVLGILGYLITLILPAIILYKKCKEKNLIVRNSSILGLVFLMTQIIAGFSDEVLNLKYMILYSMLILSISYSQLIMKKDLA